MLNQQSNTTNNLSNQIKGFKLEDFFKQKSNPCSNKKSSKLLKKEKSNLQYDENNIMSRNNKINRDLRTQIIQNNFFPANSDFSKNFDKDQESQKDLNKKFTHNQNQIYTKNSFFTKSIDKIYMNCRNSSQFNEFQLSKFNNIEHENIDIPTYKKLSQFKVDPQRNSRKSLKKANINMDFNVCQIILRYLCFCCLNKKLRLKRELYDHGNMKFIDNIIF